MTRSAVIKAAVAHVERGWTKGIAFQGPEINPAVCGLAGLWLGAGLSRSLGLYAAEDVVSTVMLHSVRQYRDYVAAAKLVMQCAGVKTSSAFANWNDMPERTKQDVLDVLNAAAEIAEQEEATAAQPQVAVVPEMAFAMA